MKLLAQARTYQEAGAEASASFVLDTPIALGFDRLRPAASEPALHPIRTRYIFQSMSQARLLRVLMLFAMVFVVIGISGGHAAMAAAPHADDMRMHGMSMPSDHCADMVEEKAPPTPAVAFDCMIACSVLPTVQSGPDYRPLAAAARPALPLQAWLAGLHPEMELPPPRLL